MSLYYKFIYHSEIFFGELIHIYLPIKSANAVIIIKMEERKW